jgi:hypothetical protein
MRRQRYRPGAAEIGHTQSRSRRPLMTARAAMRVSTRAWPGTCSSPNSGLAALTSGRRRSRGPGLVGAKPRDPVVAEVLVQSPGEEGVRF